MLEFKPVSLSDRDIFTPYLNAPGELMSTRCFPVMYLWSGFFGTEYCVREGFLFGSSGIDEEGRINYMMPQGDGPIAPAIEILEADAKERGLNYSIYLAGPCRREEIERDFPGKFVTHVHRNGFDYIYDPVELMELKGKKFQAKRNFVNRFKKEQEGRWEYHNFDPALHGEAVMDFARAWRENHRDGNNEETEDYELTLVQCAVENYDYFGLLGGFLTVDGKMAAFTFASPGPDGMLDVMFEKADASIPGAYPMINQQFALANFSGFKFINREDDLGIEGLRKSKLSYNPIFLTEKFILERVW